MFAIFHETTPSVEPLSIDEAFLDVTGSERLLGARREIAERIRAAIKKRVRLTASVGIATNKFLAKLASDMDKPDGVTEIHAGNLDRILLPLPVRRLWGIGPVAEARLETLGIRTVADVRAYGRDRLVSRLGSQGEHLFALAHGRDERDVVRDAGARSIGQECTFGHDLQDPDGVRAVLLEHVLVVARRLRRQGLVCRTVTVKIRYGAFKTVSRSLTLTEPGAGTAEIHAAALTLFDRWVSDGFRPVRLIGVTASRLTRAESGQLSLFGDPDRERNSRLDRAVDAIQERFGSKVIGRGTRDFGDTSRRDGIQRDERT